MFGINIYYILRHNMILTEYFTYSTADEMGCINSEYIKKKT